VTRAGRQLVGFGWLIFIMALLCMAPWKSVEQATTGERQILYALDDGGAATFRLGAGEQAVRVLLWLETPLQGQERSEASAWRYGAGLEFTGGGVTEQREHWTRSRMTLLPDGTQATVGPRADRVVLDSRIIDLDLGEHMAQGGSLTVRPLDLEEDQRLMVRVFRVMDRTRAEFAARLPPTVQERVLRTYPLPWPKLSNDEYYWHGSLKRLTVPAELIEGGTTEPVVRYAFPSRAPTTQEWGYRLNPGEATAVNVRGPAVLSVFAMPDGQEKREHQPSTLPIELVSAVWDPDVPPVGGSIEPHQVTVPEGAVWSLRWHNSWEDAPIWLSWSLEPDQGQSFGEPPGAGAAEPLQPEVRRITVYRVGPELNAVTVPVATARKWGVLRVEARPLTTAAWVEGRTTGDHSIDAPSAQVRWVAKDAAGEELDSGVMEVDFDHAPFERYIESEELPVSEKLTRYLYHRQDAATVEFTADALTDIRVLVPLEVQPQRAPEYGLPDDFVCRYCPWELAPYVTVAPVNVEQLILDERLFRFDATVRIEHTGDREVDAIADLETRVVRPINASIEHPVFEMLTVVKGWRPYHRTRLKQSSDLRLPEEPITVDYRIPADAVGTDVIVTCSGIQEARPLDARSGRLTFETLPAGEHTCTVDGPDDGMLLADVPGRGQRWARRTLWRADGRTLLISAPVHGEPEVLYIRPYTGPGRPAPIVTMVLDDGEVERTATTTILRTPDTRTFTPAEPRGTALLANGGSLQGWQAMRVVLGDDLTHERHVVAVQVEAPDGGPVYLRFDSTWGGATRLDTRHWPEDLRQ
jgi:hypothetical protein